MHIRGCVTTDAGKKRASCRDAAVLKVAASMRYGRIAFAVLCDGENKDKSAGVSSAIVAERLAHWFQRELPSLLQETEEALAKKAEERQRGRMLTEVLLSDADEDYITRLFRAAQPAITDRLSEIAEELQARIAGYGRLHKTDARCAASCLLLMGHEYLLMRIGNTCTFLSGDEKWEPMSDGEDGADDTRTSSFGMEEHVRPVFTHGYYKRRSGFLLCSDGFLRLQDPERLKRKLEKMTGVSERRMEHALKGLTRFVRRRGEREDAFAVMLSVQ